MIIKQLTWLSKIAREAELLISDGQYECIAFAQPCDVQEGDNLKDPLHAFIVNELMLSRKKNCAISLIKAGGLAQQCVAKVVDIKTGLVRVGNIKIMLEGKVPPGAITGDLIEFTCTRLDVW